MTIDELQVLITANTNELRNEINKANKNISGLQKTASKSTAGVSTAFKKLKQGIVALGIGKIIKDSITSGMDAIESDSLFETSLGNSADAVRSWSDEVSNALGLNAIALRKNTGTIYNMTSSMGLAEGDALKMSKGISLLTEDMASFYNLDSAEAFNKLKSGLTGETEPLKALGILVDENTIKQVAYSEGIAENGAELTQQQKVMARYVAIMKQTGNAQGDLARTINSPANQLRMLKNNITQAGVALSNFFMPAVQTILPWLNALTTVVTRALNSLASFFGMTGGGDTAEETKSVADNVGAIGDGFDDATKSAKKMKGALAGFDEMNVLSDNSGDSGGSSSAGVSASVGFELGEYDAGLDMIKSNTEALVEDIEGFFSRIGEGISFDNLIKSFGNLKEAVEDLGGKIWDGLGWAIDNILNPLAQWTIEDALPSFFNSLSTALTNIGLIDFTALQEKLLVLRDSIAPFVENVGTGLDWFLQNVLVPLAGWVIEDVLPAFLNTLSGAIDVVNQAITDIEPIFTWFWDNVLSPIAEWTGGVFVDILNGIGDALKWISDNEVAMALLEGIAIAIGLVSAALAIYDLVMKLFTVTSTGATVAGAAFGAVISFITSPITLVTLAIGALIAIIVLLVNNWDTVKEVASKCWEGIKNVWNSVATWFNQNIVQPVANFFKGMWNGLKSGASTAWAGIKSVFSSVASFFKNIFTTAWEGVKKVFSTGGKIFDGIKEGIVSVFTTVVNAIITGINKVIKLPFEGLNGILDKLYNLEILKVQPFKWLTWRAPVPEIPQLARGGVVDKPTYAMIGEAGTEAVVPLERNLGYLDKLAGMLADKIGGGGGDIHLVVKLGEKAIFDKFIEYSRDKAFETNGEVVFV